MSQKRFALWPVVTCLFALWVLLLAMPASFKTWAPGFIKNPALHFGLDLVGGTQLDFRISEEEIDGQLQKIAQEIATLERLGGDGERLANLRVQQQSMQDQKQNLVEAIRTVIERRINGLGVSEAVITPSFIGDEKHLLVECPGVVDTQECIAIVGKTIQLEFKEEFTEATEEHRASVRASAESALRRISQSGASLETVGQDLGDDLGMAYEESKQYFKDELPKGLEGIWDTKPESVKRLEGEVSVQSQDEEGQIQTEKVPGIFLTEVLRPRFQTGRTINAAPTAFAHLAKTEQGLASSFHDDVPLDTSIDVLIAGALRTMKGGELKSVAMPDGSATVLFLRLFTKGGERVTASHILVTYKGAANADTSITRSKEQALERAKALKKQLDAGANFAALARKESDGPSSSEGGSLGSFGKGVMAPPFEAAAFSLAPGSVSDPVETEFGYHLIRVDKAKSVSLDTVKYDELSVAGPGGLEKADALIARMKSGQVRSTEDAIVLRTLFFSLLPTGWKDTTLDGKHFRAASVTLDPVTNVPVVQILFDDEGGRIFQELTKRNVNKRIAIFVGGQMVSAPVVQQEISGGTAIITGSKNFDEARLLAQDLNTGAIPAPIYLVGQHTIEATLGAQALQTSLKAALLGTIILMLYMVLVYRLLGVIANAALLIYALLFFALLKVPLFLFSGTYIVLTLAGMAGIILSLGMAVDANVLVFERMKEELRKGKLVKTAVETSFIHAWPAIRDGNVSTLITCAILFMIGTSIVRGFAITLGIGVFLSMFTAIVVTRWILRRVAVSPLAENTALFCVRRSQNPGVGEVS